MVICSYPLYHLDDLHNYQPIQFHGELRCELVRRRNDTRYEQFEISPEMIEQELRPAV